MAVTTTFAPPADPSEVPRRTLALVGLAGLIVAAINLAMVQLNFYEVENPDHGSHYLAIPANLLWIFVGMYAWAKRPSNPIGRWMIAVGFAGFTYVFGLYPSSVGWLISDAFGPVQLLLIAYVFLAFPSGHLRTRPDRIVMALVIADSYMAWFLNLLANGHFLNPFYLVTDPDTQAALWAWNDLAATLLLPIVALRVIIHWRDAPPAGRRVLAPVLIGTTPYLVVLFASRLDLLFGPNQLTDMSHSYPAIILPGYALPIAFLIGLLRMQLARSVVGDVVRELDAGVEPGQLDVVLRRALGDPTLQLAYERPDGTYVDAEGLSSRSPPRPIRTASSRRSVAAARARSCSSTIAHSKPTRSSCRASPPRLGWRSRTSGCTPRSAPSSRRSGALARASSRPASTPVGRSSATSTMEPSSSCSPYRSGSRWRGARLPATHSSTRCWRRRARTSTRPSPSCGAWPAASTRRC